MTEGQKLALEQLQAIQACGEDTFEIVSELPPFDEESPLVVEVSIDCAHLDRKSVV